MPNSCNDSGVSRILPTSSQALNQNPFQQPFQLNPNVYQGSVSGSLVAEYGFQDFYTKSEILTLLSVKADKNTVYTRNEIDDLLDSINLSLEGFVLRVPSVAKPNIINPGTNDTVALTLRGSSTNAVITEWISSIGEQVGRVNNDGTSVFANKVTIGGLVGGGLPALDTQNRRITGVANPTAPSDAVPLSFMEEYVSDAISEGGGGPVLSVTDAGGDGSLAYDSETGVLTYTGPSAAEVRAHLSGGTGVTFSNGQISIGQGVATNANVEFANLTLAQLLTVQGQARVSDGAITTPSFSFTSEPGSGLYRSGPGNISVGIGGVKKATVSGSGLDVFGELNLPGALFTTTLQAVPPSEDRLISLPDRSGTLLVTDEAGAFRLDDLSDVDLSAGLYEKATICWNGSTQSWVVGPDYWSNPEPGVLTTDYSKVGIGKTPVAGPFTGIDVEGSIQTTNSVTLGGAVRMGGGVIAGGDPTVVHGSFRHEVTYAPGLLSPDTNIEVFQLIGEGDSARSVDLTIQVESSDFKYQVIKLSGILFWNGTTYEMSQTQYGNISNVGPPGDKLYSFGLDEFWQLTGYATDAVSSIGSYVICGSYSYIRSNDVTPPPPYNFEATWRNCSSLTSFTVDTPE